VGGAGALARTILLASNLDQWRSGIGILPLAYSEVAAGPLTFQLPLNPQSSVPYLPQMTMTKGIDDSQSCSKLLDS
jgi:hypothetical protein